MKTLRWLGLSVSAALARSGCGEKDVDGLQEARGDREPLVSAACGWMFGCCSDGERTFQLGDFTADATNCTERMIDAIEAGAPLQLVEVPLFSRLGTLHDTVDGPFQHFERRGHRLPAGRCPGQAHSGGAQHLQARAQVPGRSAGGPRAGACPTAA